MPTVKSILEEWLTANHFDGLYHGDFDCACDLGDLAPCDDSMAGCEPGYKTKCNCGEEHNFHMSAERDAPESTPPKRSD